MISFDPDIKLGPLKRDRLWKYFQWRNDPRIWKWCRQNDLLTELGHARWFDQIHSDPTVKMYEIINSQNECVGVCGLTSIDPVNQRAEFSLYVGPKFQNQGFAKKALVTLFTHGFQNLNLNLIWGETFDGNSASKLFEALGMVYEGTRRAYYFREGRFIGAGLYSITREEFYARSHRYNSGLEPCDHDQRESADSSTRAIVGSKYGLPESWSSEIVQKIKSDHAESKRRRPGIS